MVAKAGLHHVPLPGIHHATVQPGKDYVLQGQLILQDNVQLLANVSS